MRLPSLAVCLSVILTAGPVAGRLDYSCAGVTSDRSPGVSLPRGDLFLTPSASPVSLTCHLNPSHSLYLSGVNSSLLTFLFNSTQQTSSTVLNRTSIQISFKSDSPGVTDVACVVKHYDDRDQGICTQKVYVGFPPVKPVNDFRCISEDWKDLNCTWEEPYNPIPTNYDVSLYTDGRFRRRCPVLKDDVMSSLPRDLHMCYLSLTTDPQYRQTAKEYQFYFHATNPLNQTGAITRQDITNLAVVRPGPPVVTVTSQSSTSLEVSWNVSREMVHFPPGLNQSVELRCEWDEDWTEVDTGQLDTRDDHYSLSLTSSSSLSPFTECNISVWMSNPDSSPPLSSSPVYVLGKTRPAPPPRPPKTTLASFEVVERPHSRTVIVYWQRLSRRDQYGPDFEYVVRDLTGDILPTEVRTSHARFDSLSAAPQKISIFSANSEGSSEEYSVLDIPATEDLRNLQPRSVTKIFNKSPAGLLVSWLPPISRETDISNYTVFWCRSDNGRDTPHQCDGDIQWLTLPAATNNHTLSLDSQTVYQLAVAANYPGLSSGLQWTTCSINNRAGTVTQVTDLNLGQVDSTQVSLGWSLYCSKMGDIVNSFLVFVCEGGDGIEGGGECVSTRVGAGEESVTVSGLSPYREYRLNVTVLEAGSEQPGQPSPALRFRTDPAPPSSPVRNINTSVTDTQINITWQPPTHLNGKLCQYKISLNDDSPPRIFTESWAVLEEMLSFTRYEVSVRPCVVSREGTCVLCGDPATTTVTTNIGQPATPNSPTVRPLNRTAVAVSWDTDFHLGAPSVQVWRIKLSGGEETSEETTLTVAGQSRALNVDIASLEESDACDEKDVISKFFYVSLQSVVRDKKTGAEYSSPWSARQQILVPCYQAVPILLYIIICLAVVVLLILLYRLLIWYRRKRILFNKLRVSLDNRDLGAVTETEMTRVDTGQEEEEEEEEQIGGLVGPADQDSESEDGAGLGLRTVLLRTHNSHSSSQDSGVSSQPPPSPQKEDSSGGNPHLERSVSGYVSMSSHLQPQSSQNINPASPGYISLGQVQQPPTQPPSQPPTQHPGPPSSSTHYIKFGIEGLTKLEDSGGQYVKQENSHYCQYSYV